MVQSYRAYFSKEDFQKCPYEHKLFTEFEDEGKILIVCLCVDDLTYTRNDKAMMDDFKQSMMIEFEMLRLEINALFIWHRSRAICCWNFYFAEKVCS